MDLTAASLADTALARMQRTAPERAGSLARFFSRYDNVINPLAGAILRQAKRERDRLSGDDAPSRVVAYLVFRLAGRLPMQHEWAERYQEILKLMVRASISVLDQNGVSEPSLEQIARDLWTPPVLPQTTAERLRANARAINIVSAGRLPNPEERAALQLYTGNGGVSVERLAKLVPAEWVPSSKAPVDEYYTPPALCIAIASVLASLVAGEPLTGLALEPAAGIGRFITACEGRPELAGLRWVAVEHSRISSEICRLLHPNAEVHNAAFEQWMVENHQQVAGQLVCVITNPPYGVRGANKTIDPDKEYREEVAYVYFIRRPFDMLRGGGIGVALVPRGFLSGTGAPAQRARASVLKRHHLICAFRLPSNIYPGAEIVTDVSFWRARGGELSTVLAEDQSVLEGRYFDEYPEHIIGKEIISSRGRHIVEGEFNGFPKPIERVQCQHCAVTPFIRAVRKKEAREDGLTEDLQAAHQLGMRIERYFSLVGSPKSADVGRGANMHLELVEAVRAWQRHRAMQTGIEDPLRDSELVKESRYLSSFAALLSVFEPGGTITSILSAPPQYVAPYTGPGTVNAHAEWVYAKHRSLTLTMLRDFRTELGFNDSDPDLERELVAQGWCEDWAHEHSVWIPATDYYTGELWPKLDSARERDSERAHAQAARLLELIGVVSIEDASPTLRDAWLPPDITQSFLSSLLSIEVPILHWYRALLKPEGIEYSQIGNLDERLQTAIGFINHDLNWFHPPYSKQTNPSTGEEESAEQAKDRARLAYGDAIQRRFRSWLNEAPERQDRVLDSYQRTFRGYIAPVYDPRPLPIARWGNRVTLKPHQCAGAWRLIRNNGGLLAFDVGVGKTLTGIAALAHLREIGRARRPLVIVPNSIIWKWHREVVRALPDYRIVVIGAVRYQSKDGIFRSRVDEPDERARKWAEFRQGLYDVAICSYSMLPRTSVRAESLRQFIEETPTLLREMGLKTANLATELERLSKLYEEREALARRVAALELEMQAMAEDDDTDFDDVEEDSGDSADE